MCRLVFANSEATKATHAQADIWIYDWATSSTRVARAPSDARPERPPQRTLGQLTSHQRTGLILDPLTHSPTVANHNNFL